MTTFRALANPAFVAVTETVTFSPWTSASFDTVCCCCCCCCCCYAQREKEDESQKSRRQRAEEVMTLASSVVEFDRGTDDDKKEKTRVESPRTCCTKMCAFSDANAKDAMTVDAKTPKSTVFTTPGDDDTKTFLVV